MICEAKVQSIQISFLNICFYITTNRSSHSIRFFFSQFLKWTKFKTRSNQIIFSQIPKQIEQINAPKPDNSFVPKLISNLRRHLNLLVFSFLLFSSNKLGSLNYIRCTCVYYINNRLNTIGFTAVWMTFESCNCLLLLTTRTNQKKKKRNEEEKEEFLF